MSQHDLFSEPIAEASVETEKGTMHVKGPVSAVLELTSIELARKQRDTILLSQEVANGKEFNMRMRAFIQEYLEKNGPSSGESITNAAKEAGIVPVRGDDRAYGGSYLSLSKRKVIVKAGSCQRARGHATGGGIIWALANQ